VLYRLPFVLQGTEEIPEYLDKIKLSRLQFRGPQIQVPFASATLIYICLSHPRLNAPCNSTYPVLKEDAERTRTDVRTGL
jgi:hypothetical protein